MKTLISVLFFIHFLSNVFAQNTDNTSRDIHIGKTPYAEVTYPGIGHFTTKDFIHPIHRPVGYLPQSPEKIKTRFLLHTRRNLNNAQELEVGDHNIIKNSYFNAKHPIKFIVHGWMDNRVIMDGEWMQQMKDEFLKADDYNVIIVDWSGGNGISYTKATANTRVVGPVISNLINDLKTVFGFNLSNVHILGHSLGAHVAGYAGEKMQGQIGRITGLDPAGPYFENLKNPAATLDATDAQFVDAIHTDAKFFIPRLGFGMMETSGHLDFYPNGGSHQTGCIQQRFTTVVIDDLSEGARRLGACNHQRAVDYYIASINPKSHKGVGHQCQDFESFKRGKCYDCGSGDKCAIIGEDAILSLEFRDTTRGSRFFLRTSGKYPYFTNDYEIKIKLSQPSDDRLSTHGILMVTLHGTNSDEEIILNSKGKIFRLGQTYSFIKNIGYNLGDIESVTFRWHRALSSIVHRHMWIDSITVVPLSTINVIDREEHIKEIKTFCTTNRNEGLLNENDYQFSVNCK